MNGQDYLGMVTRALKGKVQDQGKRLDESLPLRMSQAVFPREEALNNLTGNWRVTTQAFIA